MFDNEGAVAGNGSAVFGRAYFWSVILYVKNMVCNRCVKAVQSILAELDISFTSVRLGEVWLETKMSNKLRQQLEARLQADGFALITDRRNRIIEQIKRLVLERVRTDNTPALHENLSAYLSASLHLDYPYLSHLFSSVEGLTIEKYLIAQKIERAKELLVCDELSLSEIADKLGYSSVQHLSNQFRKTTGLTPTHFKKIGAERRKPLDGIH